ncbi:MAG: CoA-binding protein [Ignavibacteriales bacterium]|nr:CoA-binding protein [Ignavibacteriales bacterium]
MRSVCQILNESKTIAVVGISDKIERDSRSIAFFLKENGYDVVGVNPHLKNVDDIIVYPSLESIPFKIDIVDVFRRTDAIPDLIPDVLKVKPKTLWLQLGIRNDKAVKPVIDVGIEVIQNKCILIEFNNCK